MGRVESFEQSIQFINIFKNDAGFEEKREWQNAFEHGFKKVVGKYTFWKRKNGFVGNHSCTNKQLIKRELPPLLF